MNNDLISRSALKEEFEKTQYNDFDDLTRTERLIDNAPTVEAIPTELHEKIMDMTVGGLTVTNKELESIKFNDPRQVFTKICGTCKYADVPSNRKPCCSCRWLERESHYEEADNE